MSFERKSSLVPSARLVASCAPGFLLFISFNRNRFRPFIISGFGILPNKPFLDGRICYTNFSCLDILKPHYSQLRPSPERHLLRKVRHSLIFFFLIRSIRCQFSPQRLVQSLIPSLSDSVNLVRNSDYQAHTRIPNGGLSPFYLLPSLFGSPFYQTPYRFGPIFLCNFPEPTSGNHTYLS